jgi:hypothetical protein
MRKGYFLGIQVKIIDLNAIVQAIKENGLDYVYEVLERLFLTENFVIINKDGKVVLFPFDLQEISDFLELIDRKFNTTEEIEEEVTT